MEKKMNNVIMVYSNKNRKIVNTINGTLIIYDDDRMEFTDHENNITIKFAKL